MRIACIGECTNDFYLEQGQGYIGGISLNCAVHARRCGAQHVALVSCVGDDLPGQRARQRLVEEGIDISHLHTRPGRTPQQDIRLLPDGERVFPPGGYHLGVLQDFRLSADDLAFIRQHDVVDLALFTQVQPLFEQVLHDRGFTGRRAADLLDFGDYGRQYLRIADFMNALDLLFISGGEDTLAALAPLSRDFAGCLVVTMGVRGSAALVNGTMSSELDCDDIHLETLVHTSGPVFSAALPLAEWKNRSGRDLLTAFIETALARIGRDATPPR